MFRFGVWVLFVVFGVSVLCVALGRGGSFWVFPGYFFSVVWVDVDFLFWWVFAVVFWVCPWYFGGCLRLGWGLEFLVILVVAGFR